MKSVGELLKEKEQLQQYLEWGRNILVFDELNTVKEKITEINNTLERMSK